MTRNDGVDHGFVSLGATLKFSVDRNGAQKLEVAQHFPRAEYHGRQWIVRDGNWQARFFPNALIEILDERATPGQNNAAVADIRGEFGRRALEGHPNGVDDRGDVLRERLANFAVVDG